MQRAARHWLPSRRRCRHRRLLPPFHPPRPVSRCTLQALHATAVWALPPHRQDRISSSGEWVPASPGSGATTQQQPGEQQRSPQQPYVIGSTIDPTATAPAVPPVSSAAIDRLAELLQSARGGLVLTGAGCSTESGESGAAVQAVKGAMTGTCHAWHLPCPC